MPEHIFSLWPGRTPEGPRHIGHVAGFPSPSHIFARYQRLRVPCPDGLGHLMSMAPHPASCRVSRPLCRPPAGSGCHARRCPRPSGHGRPSGAGSARKYRWAHRSRPHARYGAGRSHTARPQREEYVRAFASVSILLSLGIQDSTEAVITQTASTFGNSTAPGCTAVPAG